MSCAPEAPAWRRGLLLLAFALLAGGCARDGLYRQEAYVFGTRVEVLVYGESRERARAAAAAVLAEFDRLHQLLHAWQPSELTRINAAIARGDAAPLSSEVADILRGAAALAAAGDDLFNPAIGKLIGLWGFQSEDFAPRRPDPARIAELVAAQPRMADLDIGSDTLTSRNRAVALDLGGYAKGYALDAAAALLRARGVENALVNIGGNILALGRKGDQAWRVGIQHPRAATPLATLDLADGEAIGTSGDYQRYFELDGRRYCHLIDPRDGHPVRHTQALTVLVTGGAAAGARSDGASKPLFIAGPQHWRALAARLEVGHALRVDADGKISLTRAMQQRLRFEPGIAASEVVE